MTSAARIVLVGAGHAHLHVAAQARTLIDAGASVTLVDPGDFWYSGRATGMLGGHLDAGADRLDARRLIETAGGRFLADSASAFDRAHRRVTLAGGGALDYDWLSLNVGSVIRTDTIEGLQNDPDCWPVKPIAGLWRLRETLAAEFAANSRPRIAVIGGGATGCEIAANLAALARRERAPVALQLLHSGTRLADAAPAGASRWLAQWLRIHGITVQTGRRVIRRTPGALVLDDGQRMAADIVVLATGLQAPAWLDTLGQPGYSGVAIDATLRSLVDDRVFAAGDCARLRGHALPRLGVFGVRQAPILLNNLAAAIAGRHMRSYHPQRRWLSILDLGDGTALATRGARWWHGRSSLWLKHWLDHRFMQGYRQHGA